MRVHYTASLIVVQLVAAVVGALGLMILPNGAMASDEQGWQSYSQIRYTSFEDKGDYLSVRRLKLYGGGRIAGNWSYYMQFLYKTGNFSSTDDQIFVQEFNAILKTQSGKITIGQFKPPFGMERFEPDWSMPLIDRTQASDRLIPNGSVGDSFTRDRGIQWQTSPVNGFNYAVGVFDGNGANEHLRGNGPLVAGRGVYERRGDDTRFHAEAAVSWRRDHDIDFLSQFPGAPKGYTAFAGQDARQDLALAYDWAGNSLWGEYIASQYHSDKSSVQDVHANGFYIQLARDFSKRWQGAVRYERLNTDLSAGNSQQWTTVGATYRIHSDYEKLQINYVIKHERPSEIKNNALIVQYQRFF